MKAAVVLLVLSLLSSGGCASISTVPASPTTGAQMIATGSCCYLGYLSPWHIISNDFLGFADDDQLTMDPLGKVWFTAENGSALGFIDQSYVWTMIPLYRASPTGIALGPDRRIWYSDFGGGVGVLTTLGRNAHVITYPTPGYGARRIVAGRHGFLWVSLWTYVNGVSHSAIGKLSTTGTLTVYPLPNQNNTQIYGLAIGQQGEVWFADQNGHVGYLVPSTLKITEYPTPQGFYPANIAFGSDGELYVVGGGTTAIGVVTQSGVFKTIATDLGLVSDIARGPDGHIWISGQDATQTHWVLARKTAAGFVDHVYPKSSCCIGTIPMGGLIAGLDGDVWFIAEGAYYNHGHGYPIGWIGDFLREN